MINRATTTAAAARSSAMASRLHVFVRNHVSRRLRPRIDLYTRCWNDAHMLGFFFRHYDPVVQRYVVFDDGSTDRSLDLLRSNPKVELRAMPEPSDPTSYVASGVALFDECWKESCGRADWVIITDIDEHLYHPQLKDYLSHCARHGVSVVPALGYQMMAEKFPPESCLLSEACTLGAPYPLMSKLNIFSPDKIQKVEFEPGRHNVSLWGSVVAPARDELLLLHYKYLGFENTLRRYQQYNTRRKPRDVAMHWGFQYSWSTSELREAWDQCAAQLIDVLDPHLIHDLSYPKRPWWNDFARATEVYRAPWSRVVMAGMRHRLKRSTMIAP